MLQGFNRFQSLISTCFFVLAALIWHENVDAASLQLSWADNSQNEDGFDIERKTGNGGAFLALTTMAANQSSYTDANLSDGTTYCYRVRAFNSVGGSPYSNEACATTSASAPTPPANRQYYLHQYRQWRDTERVFGCLDGCSFRCSSSGSNFDRRHSRHNGIATPRIDSTVISGTLNTNTLAMAPIS